MALHRQMGEEALHRLHPQRIRMLPPMEQHEPAGPLHVGLFRPQAVAPHPHRIPHPIQQPGRRRERLPPHPLTTGLPNHVRHPRLHPLAPFA